MECWLFLPQSHMTLDEVVALARTAEEAGYDGLALIDHLVTPLAEHQVLHEAMLTATWIAAHTRTLRLGHLVLCDALRHPALLAKQAITLDHASGGRFELGIGWGSWPSELVGFGVTEAGARERATRLVDSVGRLRQLLDGGPVVPGGPVLRPLPLTRIPVVIGGVGPTALRLAREHADWWNVTAPRVDRLTDVRDRVAPARVSAQLMVALDRPGEQPGTALARALGHFPTFPTGIVGGSPQRVAEEVAALDLERLYVWLAPPPDRDKVEQVAASLLPLLG